MRRGDLRVRDKGFNAEQAGAVAVFMVNDGRCGDFPAGDDCVINMGPGDLGGLVTIPLIQVSQADGEPIIAAVENGETVEGILGSSSTFSVHAWALVGRGRQRYPTTPMTSASQRFRSSTRCRCRSRASPSTRQRPQPAWLSSSPTTSTGGPTAWAWDFGDGGTSTEQNPSYTFTSAGTFSVSLMVTNAGGTEHHEPGRHRHPRCEPDRVLFHPRRRARRRCGGFVLPDRRRHQQLGFDRGELRFPLAAPRHRQLDTHPVGRLHAQLPARASATRTFSPTSSAPSPTSPARWR